MAVNKVQIGEDEVLIDLSSDTVEEMAVDDGVQFHDSNGEIRQGARVIDDAMSDTSTNAPQNKVVKKYVDDGLAKKSNIGHTHDSADIVSGVLATDRIPTITSSKIESLDASKLTGTVPASVLPSYVDDVIEGYFYSDNFYKDSSHTTAITGETGKIYVSLDTNKTYRYSGSKFVVISETIALGETSSTAYRGDRGKTAYDHASAKGSAFSNILGKVTTNAQGHVTGITAVTKADITALGIPGQDTTYGTATTSANGLMSASDKSKLDGIASGANAYSLPTATASVLGGVKTGSNITNTNGVISLTKANVTSALGYTPPTTNTTYSKATASTDGLESKEHYSKIEGIASGAEVNQNAFSNVTIGENTIAADSKTDTLTLVAGSNVTLTADTTNDKVTIAAKDTTYSTATTSANGLMSASDKSKLDGIASGANAYSLPTATASVLGGVKTGSNITNTNGVISLTKANVTSALGYTPEEAGTTTEVTVTPTLTSGTKIGSISVNGTSKDLYCQTNTDTHYTTKLIVGASATANANAAATNGNVYLNVLDNSTIRNAHKITGSGATTVTSDANGNITINSTNTTYTALKNPNALTLSLNGTSQGAYDGSAAKSINITPSAIGAAASSHNHAASNITSGTLSVDRLPSIPSSKITSLDSSKLTGTIPESILPSYVDDVIEGYFYSDNFYKDSDHTTAITGETGKIYVSLDTNKTYRYSGSKFVVISETIALGETSSTAYRGDRGKTAYDHASAKGSAFSNVLGKVTTNAQGHVTGITAVTKADMYSIIGIATTGEPGLMQSGMVTHYNQLVSNGWDQWNCQATSVHDELTKLVVADTDDLRFYHRTVESLPFIKDETVTSGTTNHSKILSDTNCFILRAYSKEKNYIDLMVTSSGQIAISQNGTWIRTI